MPRRVEKEAMGGGAERAPKTENRIKGDREEKKTLSREEKTGRKREQIALIGFLSPKVNQNRTVPSLGHGASGKPEKKGKTNPAPHGVRRKKKVPANLS